MKYKKQIIGLCSIIIVGIVFFVVYSIFSPKPTAGKKNITVSVNHADGSVKDFKYSTDEEYLGPVLKGNKLVEGIDGDYGLFITSVDGEEAKDSLKQWWCLTKSNEMVTTSADQTPIRDGDHYELTLSTY